MNTTIILHQHRGAQGALNPFLYPRKNPTFAYTQFYKVFTRGACMIPSFKAHFTIPQIITALNQENTVPNAAIHAALAYGKEIVPALLAEVKNAADNFQKVKGADVGYITALYILAKLREPQACKYILQIASLYRDWPEKLLGDVRTEGLTSLIVSTYDGNLQAIKNLIEHTHAELFCRSSALDSLLGLFSIGKLSRVEVVEYLRTILRSPLVSDYEFAEFVLNAVFDLYPEELWDDAMQLFDQIITSPWMTSKAEFEEVRANSMKACLKQNIYENKWYQPIDNVIAEIAWLYRAEETEDPFDGLETKAERKSDCACCNTFGTQNMVKSLLDAEAAEEGVDA